MTDNKASVEILDEGPCTKRMKAEIPAETVTEEIDANYRQLRQTIQIPGFRKGHVPRSLLERRFAKQIEEEVQEEMVHSTFFEEVSNRELRVLGSPNFEDIHFKAGDPLRYDAVFEVEPAYDLGDYTGLEIAARPAVVSDDDVERELESLREQYATLEPVPLGEQREDDVAVVDIAFFVGEEEVLRREEVYLKVGSDRVDSLEVEGLTKSLLDCKEDQELRFQVQIPADFGLPELRERSLDLRITVHDAKRKQLPDLDQEFAGRFGVDDIDSLREEMRRNLELRRKVQEDHRQEEEIVERLSAGIEMDLPPKLVERHKQEISLGRRFRLLREGKPTEEIDQAIEADESIEKEAREDLKKQFILDRIAREEKIFVTEDEIAQRIAVMAATQNKSPEEVLEEHRSRNLLDELRANLLMEKVRAFLREKADIKGGTESGADGGAAGETDTKENETRETKTEEQETQASRES